MADRSRPRERSRSPVTARRGDAKMEPGANNEEVSVEREKTCPMLLRVFYSMGRHHRSDEFNRNNVYLPMSCRSILASPEDVDKAVSQGFGLRYSFMGPLETMHINTEGIDNYCQRYAANILTICETQAPPRPFQGPTLDTLREYLEKAVPLDKLAERRRWREDRLAALALHQKEVAAKETQARSPDQ